MKDGLIIFVRAWVPHKGAPFFQYQATGLGSVADRFFEWLDARYLEASKVDGLWTHWVFKHSASDQLIRSRWPDHLQDRPTFFENFVHQESIAGIEAYRDARQVDAPRWVDFTV